MAPRIWVCPHDGRITDEEGTYPVSGCCRLARGTSRSYLIATRDAARRRSLWSRFTRTRRRIRRACSTFPDPDRRRFSTNQKSQFHHTEANFGKMQHVPVSGDVLQVMVVREHSPAFSIDVVTTLSRPRRSPQPAPLTMCSYLAYMSCTRKIAPC